MNEAEVIAKFARLILQLPEEALDNRCPPHRDLLIDRAGPFEVFYAPMDYINSSAKVTIVGLTPGKHTMVRALALAKSMVQSGASWPEAREVAKRRAAFSNTRNNIAEMLDKIGLCEWLRKKTGNPSIVSCRELFETADSLVQLTSVIRYPTYFNGKNYSGSPDPLSYRLLREMIDTLFRMEVQQLPDTVYVPLGDAVSRVFEYLQVEDRRVLSGLPHPSGQNVERIAYFLGKKPRHLLSKKTNADKIDAAKRRLSAKVGELIRDC